MIKVQGLGRRRAGMSHHDAIEHHRNIHSKLGIGQADHMARYVLYYFREALDAEGKPLADFPWDMSALEWFREDAYWDNFQQWLEAAPDGQEVKEDEGNFLDRDQCFLMPYQEEVVVDRPASGETIDLLRLLSFAPGAVDNAVRVAAVRDRLGDALRKLTINRIDYATRLSSGRIPDTPVDLIEIYKVDRAAFADGRALVRALADPAGNSQFDHKRTIHFVAEEADFTT